jgi:U3 small nucleolar RNA-associated protein 3
MALRTSVRRCTKTVGYLSLLLLLCGKLTIPDEFLQPSDEEVLGYDDDEDEDLEHGNAGSDSATSAAERVNDEDDEENLRDWGTSKADYYNADAIETEADALEEEQEARRLQQKHLQNLTEADFGYDENQWMKEDNTGLEPRRDVFSERLPELSVKEDASSEERAQILRSHYPEFEPLAKDFVELQNLHEELALASNAAEAAIKVENSLRQGKPGGIVEDMLVHTTPIAISKFRALSAYLGTIGMYFALLTSTTNSTSSNALAMSPAQLRDHAVVQSLFRSRQLWEAIKDTPIPEIQTKNIARDENKLVEAVTEPEANGMGMSTAVDSEPVTKKKRRTKAERAAIKAQELAQAERQVQIQKAEAKLADLDTLISVSRKEAKARPIAATANGGNDSDFGDEDALTAQEAAEKAHRKKSLRFYTSQIAQKSNKRGAASRDAGGDTDLPYKERLKDRQARLMREAEKKGRSTAGQGERLGSDGSGDDAEDTRLAKEVRGDDADEDGYYDMVSARTQQKKDDRKALAEAQARAAEQGGQVYVEEEVGPDGKRAITYAIAKNKGLAPRRKKEVRNPRVKKKIRYEKALKKLGSIRQVYKGGEGRGGYGGELTGIKTNVLKGVKL